MRAAALSFSLLTASTAQAEPVPAVVQAEGAPIDPARLEAATKSADCLLPKASYAKIMGGTINGMMKPMLDSFGKTPLRDLAEMTGADEERPKAIGSGKVN